VKGPIKIIALEEHYGLPFIRDAAREANDLLLVAYDALRKGSGSERFHRRGHRKDRLNFDRG
jgi:hypothetical protein